MGGDNDNDDELLADLLATLDGDYDFGLQHTALGNGPTAGSSLSGGIPCAYSDERARLLLLEAGGDAALGLFSPPLRNGEVPIEATAAPTGLVTGSSSVSIDDYANAAVVTPPTTTALSCTTALQPGNEILDGSTSCSTATTAPIQDKKSVPKRKYDPNKARNERSKEIRGLRSEVAELTAQLGALETLTVHDARGENKRLGSGRSTLQGQVVSAELTGAPPVWEAICRNQLARRVRAERENARLKRALDEQVKVTNSLKRLLHKPTKAQKFVDGQDACSSRRVYTLPSDSVADAEIFAKLVAEVDASYYEINGVFELNGINEPGDETRRGSHMRDGEHGRFVDMFSSNVLPFSVDATADVVWRFYSGPSKHRGPLYYKTAKALEPSENTIVEKFAIELFANNTRADFRVWQVMRRYVEVDRVLVVWMGIVEPVEFANKSFSGCAFREKGYVACNRASVGGGADAPAFTRLQRCHRVVPCTTHSADAVLSKQDKREIGAVIDFILNLDSISAHLERFEDELMQQSLRRQPATQQTSE